MTQILVMGTVAAATDLVGVRVRVIFEGNTVSIEGRIRAVGSCKDGLRMWVEQELENHWYPKGELHDVGGACRIQIVGPH